MGALRNFGPHPLREPPPHFALANQSAPFLRFLCFWLIYENLAALKFALINIRNLPPTAHFARVSEDCKTFSGNGKFPGNESYSREYKGNGNKIFKPTWDPMGMWIPALCTSLPTVGVALFVQPFLGLGYFVPDIWNNKISGLKTNLRNPEFIVHMIFVRHGLFCTIFGFWNNEISPLLNKRSFSY